MASREPLGVWLNDAKVAVFIERGPKIRCRYLLENLLDLPLNSPALSCSLPLARGRLDATNFATGLLPEGQHPRAMADLAQVRSGHLRPFSSIRSRRCGSDGDRPRRTRPTSGLGRALHEGQPR